VVVYVLCQFKMASSVESMANKRPFTMSVTGSHMNPVVELERLDLAR